MFVILINVNYLSSSIEWQTILEWITMIRATGCIPENSQSQKWKHLFMILILNKVEMRYKISKWISVSHEGLMPMAVAVHWKQLESRENKWNNSFQTMSSRRKNSTVISERKNTSDLALKFDPRLLTRSDFRITMQREEPTQSPAEFKTEIKILGSWVARIWNFERDTRELNKKRKRRRVRESERKSKKDKFQVW